MVLHLPRVQTLQMHACLHQHPCSVRPEVVQGDTLPHLGHLGRVRGLQLVQRRPHAPDLCAQRPHRLVARISRRRRALAPRGLEALRAPAPKQAADAHNALQTSLLHP